ncbi:hypothetical protein TRAPUB_8628 [Trametes pubescens]|uniref:Uncharacterized protein n=1 Tax=Trametes pubescens TaxID=154538 RepID=A0A1M2W4P0_TRAPU|nr:hypothetical protein TRAPUB_8628 [Trametes pubescens]
MQAEAAAAALGRGGGGTRAFVLDEDYQHHGGATRFVGSGPASSGGGAATYDRLRGGNNNLESPTGDDGGISPVGDARSQDDAGGGFAGLAPVPIIGAGEDATLMHPANRSAADITLPADPSSDEEIGVLPPLRQPTSPTRSIASRRSSGPGPEPAAWLGGRTVSYNSLRSPDDPFRSSAAPMSPTSATSPASRSSIYSDEGQSNVGHMSLNPDVPLGAAATLGAMYTSRNTSMSSHGHSSHGHAGAGTGSSSGGHGSSSGHKTGSSSGGHKTGSSSGHMRSGLPVPSSLLPTQIQRAGSPPSAYADGGDEESGRMPGNPRRMSGFLGRSLRGLRIRSPRHSVSSVSGVVTPPMRSTSPAVSSTLLSSASPRQSVYDPASIRPSSIFRPQSPTLGALPESTVSQAQGASGQAASGDTHPFAASTGVSAWPGFAALFGPQAMPSPALTEGSSVYAPDGLLDPSLGLGARPGMQSQGALSFRDDMDYSRPIGGVSSSLRVLYVVDDELTMGLQLVNNRQYSRTTIQTMSTRDPRDPHDPHGSQRRPSLESHDTQTTTTHPHIDIEAPPAE